MAFLGIRRVTPALAAAKTSGYIDREHIGEPMRRLLHAALCIASGLLTVAAQPRITAVETIPFQEHRWGFARFTPDGKKILFSTMAYDGIWEYTLATKGSRQLTSDPGSGYNYSVSADGKTIAYRRSVAGKTWRDRKQEIVSLDVARRTTKVLGAARSISTPTFDGNSPAFLQSGAVFNPAPSKNRVTLLGVESQKIQLLVNGQRRQLDPMNGGNYIWPNLSPDGSSLVAYDMDRGAFVCDLTGKLVAQLGTIDGPTWTRDGLWVIGFDEENDGHAIIGSDLIAVKKDGTGRSNLTNSSDIVELYPSSSPTENKIVCHTMDGKLLIISYEVRP